MRRFLYSMSFALVVAACLAFAGCSAGSPASSSAAAGDASSSAASVSTASTDASSASAAASSAASEPAAFAASAASDLAVGTYEVDVTTDSSMFHLNESCDGKGTLTVLDDGMSVHMTLVSKKIVNLYAGTAAQAEADEAGWIQPTTDTVTYDDGMTEEVYGFDVPVPALGEPFDVAILGSKGKWYDHNVTVANPIQE